MIMRAQDSIQKSPKPKTIFIGFHDGQKRGEKPETQVECDPMILEITHSQAARIINHLYKELERITSPAMAGDSGIWP